MRIILIMLLMLTLSTAKKVALVIGNSDYGQGFLPNPTKDADLIAQNLRDVGFSVTVKKNLSTVYQMEKAIDDFAGIVKDDDIAVIYYAGHGVQCKGKNYLIPTKATINRGGQLPSKALNLDVVIGAVSDIKLAIIMLDACRNNTYPSCSKSQTRGLVQPKINSAGGMIVSFATASNEIALDGNGNHSPYALALSKFMKQKMPIETYFREVGGEVFRSSSQRPMLKNSFYGKFSFGESSGGAEVLVPNPKETSSKSNNESKFSTSHKTNNNYINKNYKETHLGKPFSFTVGISQVGVKKREIVTINNINYLKEAFLVKRNWKEAKSHCSQINFNGLSWRLPSRYELSNLSTIKLYYYNTGFNKWYEKNKFKLSTNSKGDTHFIRSEFLEDVPRYSGFWTSELKDSYNAWGILFSKGVINSDSIYDANYVLCVNGVEQ